MGMMSRRASTAQKSEKGAMGRWVTDHPNSPLRTKMNEGCIVTKVTFGVKQFRKVVVGVAGDGCGDGDGDDEHQYHGVRAVPPCFFEGLLAQSSSLPALSMEAMFW